MEVGGITPRYLKKIKGAEMPSFFMGGIMGITLIFKNNERLPYGSGSRGKFVPAEKGRRSIFVPSFGTMEKEEVDYVVETAQGQEDERIKRKGMTIQKERLEQVVEATRQAPRGEKAKTAREIINGGS